MKKNTYKKTIILINAAILLSLYNYNGASIAQYSDVNLQPVNNQETANNYYQKGMNFYNANEFSNAITEFEQALKLNPQDNLIRNNLAAAYISRGTYLFNSKSSFPKAANDFRCAIFYLKYDQNSSNDRSVQENLTIANSNLIKILTEQKISLTSKSRLKLAKELRGQGNFKEASVEFYEALGEINSRQEIYEALGDIMLVLQNNIQSAEYYKNALAIDNTKGYLHLKLARILSKINNIDEAINEFNIALDLSENDQEILNSLETIWQSKLQENPQDAIAHMNLGVILQKKGNFEGAMAQYKAAEMIDPNNLAKNVKVRINLGTLYQAQGNIDMALQAYDSILQINPADALTHYYRATALKQLGRTKDAIDEFQISLKINPNNIKARNAILEAAKQSQNPDEVLFILDSYAKNNPNDASAQYNLAYEFHSRKKIDEALNLYQKTILLDPKLVDAYLNTASIYKEKGQLSESLQTLENALVVSPGNKKIKEMLDQIKEESTITDYQTAVDKFNQGKYQEAIDEYLKIIAGGDNSPEVYLNLGAAYHAINNNDESIKYYTKAIETDKDNFTALYSIGTAYFNKKNFDKSIEFYQKAVTIQPDNTDAKEALFAAKQSKLEILLDKGLNEYNAKKYQKALEIFNSAIKTDSNNGYAYYYRGMVYDAFKNYTAAISDYKKAVEKSNDLQVAYYSMAYDYEMIKNTAEAKKAYQKFISLSNNQNDEYVKYAKQRIKQIK